MMQMEDEGKNAMKRLAAMRTKNKMSKASKVGKMLDEMDMKNAPQRPFISKAKKKFKPMTLEMKPAMRKKSTQKFKPGGDK